jgi:hypothetical protein
METHDETGKDTRAARTDRPETTRAERDDPRASPLGRGADPGPSVETGPLTASGTGGAAGPHGMGVPDEKGGPEGMLHRENEDAVPTARRDPRDYA